MAAIPDKLDCHAATAGNRSTEILAVDSAARNPVPSLASDGPQPEAGGTDRINGEEAVGHAVSNHISYTDLV